MIPLIISSVIVTPIVFRLIQVRIRNRKTDKLLKSKNTPMAKSLAKELSFGASIAGLSVFDIYSTFPDSKNAYVLDVMEQRFPNEMGDANAVDWINKVSEGKNTVTTYERNYAGEQAEIESMEHLRELGYTDVKQFPDKNHPNDDIMAMDPEGNEVFFSVKSYKDVGNFKDVVAEHPESTHYIVNSEVYEKLESSGDLEAFQSDGIEIVNGGFSHIEHLKEAEVAFNGIETSVEVFDDIGVVAVAFFGVKTVNNVGSYLKGGQSIGELGVNVGGDVVGVGARGVGAAAGAEIGAAIGTVFCPGIGSVVGGLLGAITGCVTAGDLVEGAKEEMKWGDIIKAIEHFGNVYYPFFQNPKQISFKDNYDYVSDNILNKVCRVDNVNRSLKKDRERLEKGSSFLSRIGLSPRTPKEALLLLHIKGLKKYLKKASVHVDNCFKNLKEVAEKVDANIPLEDANRDQKIHRLVGELVLENKDFFFDKKQLHKEEKKLIRDYTKQVRKNPNHPYKIFEDSSNYIKKFEKDFVSGFAKKKFA